MLSVSCDQSQFDMFSPILKSFIDPKHPVDPLAGRLEPTAVDAPTALLAQDFVADSHRFKTDVSALFEFLRID